MTFLKNTLYILASNFLVIGMSFFLRPLTARFLGPAEYGLFALILSTSTIIPALTLFSLNSGVFYYTAKENRKDKKFVSTALAFVFIASLVFFLPLDYAAAAFVPALGQSGFLAALALSIALSAFTILQAVQQGLEKFRAFSLYSVASALFAGAAAVAVAFHSGNGMLASFGRAAAVFAIAFIGLASLKCIGKPDRRELGRLLHYSAPLALAGFLGAFIVVTDRYLIAAYRSVAEVGYYDISYSMIAAVLPVSTALLTTMMPKLIKSDSKLAFYYSKISQANAILLSAAGLVFFYYSDIIVTMLLGPNFREAVLPFKILSLALPLMTLYGLNVAAAAAVGRTKVSGLLTSALTVFSLGFNFLLVPAFGAVGASWANFFTYVFTCGVGFYYLKTRYGAGISQVLPQYALFSLFILIYMAFLQANGFILKTAALCVFAISTYALNRPIAHEFLQHVKSSLVRK
ncbi:TPA: oligosaccharide flippase family protein [Candidatus Micrarchaeota archaeon]|nr:oligosaccharide flippase family protein [Candidatus Micrarchaeota archaeon]